MTKMTSVTGAVSHFRKDGVSVDHGVEMCYGIIIGMIVL